MVRTLGQGLPFLAQRLRRILHHCVPLTCDTPFRLTNPTPLFACPILLLQPAESRAAQHSQSGFREGQDRTWTMRLDQESMLPFVGSIPVFHILKMLLRAPVQSVQPLDTPPSAPRPSHMCTPPLHRDRSPLPEVSVPGPACHLHAATRPSRSSLCLHSPYFSHSATQQRTAHGTIRVPRSCGGLSQCLDRTSTPTRTCTRQPAFLDAGLSRSLVQQRCRRFVSAI